jgi:hypothetical protein
MNGYTLSDLGYTTRDWLIGAGVILAILTTIFLINFVKVKWWNKLSNKEKITETSVLLLAITGALIISALILIFVPLIVFELVTGRFF